MSAEHNSVFAAVRQALERDARNPTPLPAFELGNRASTDLATQFRTMLEAVGGHFFRAADCDALQEYLATLLTRERIGTAAVSDSPLLDETGFRNFLCERVNRVLDSKTPRSNDELAGVQLGVTSCRYAIAETGTILITSEEQNRRISLLPDIHVAIFRPEQLVATLAEALRALPSPVPPAMALITGPSRTADIELTLTVGVHGPKQLHAILIGG